MSHTPLPYVFDLLYDIKTLEQLNDHLSGKQRCATSATDPELYELARNNGVSCVGAPMPSKLGEMYGICEPHLVKPEGAMCPFCRATKLEALLVILTREEAGLAPDLVAMIRKTLKETGYGHH